MTTDLAERLNAVERRMDNPNTRPKDAATLLILDRSNPGDPRVLMGRRHERHRFMPGKFVFPGGRIDPSDSRITPTRDYDETVMAKMMFEMKGPKTEARARAFAVAAMRETYEEAGVFVGDKTGEKWSAPADFAAFAERGIRIDLAPVRLIARAITPPRRPRRFDTRFLAVWSDQICDQLAEGTGPTGELEDLHWLDLEQAKGLDLPTITLTIIEELQSRLRDDSDLDPATPVPFYQWRTNRFVRDLI